jgi:Zn-finger in ubiquitin-hydrolases and other protein
MTTVRYEVVGDGAGRASDRSCGHLDEVRAERPTAVEGCEDCLREGTTWVHLRLCLVCGHVRCCDSSPRRHATAHWTSTRHPLVCSLEEGEEWGWCYADELLLMPTGS